MSDKVEAKKDLMKSDRRYLHGEDLRKSGKWADVTVTVKEVGEKDSAKTEQGQVIAGYPISFTESPKILVTNETNTKLLLASMETDSRSAMAGKKITVYPAVLAECFGQRNVICVRIRVRDGLPKPFIQPKHLGKDLTK